MAGRGLEDYPTAFVSSSPRFEIIAGVFQAEHPGGMEDIMICMDNPLARQPLNPRLDLWSHSPTGFEWGYPGSGPAQLSPSSPLRSGPASLVRSAHDGICFDRVEPAYQRYVVKPVVNRHEMWSRRHSIRRVTPGQILCLIVAADATVVWSACGSTACRRKLPRLRPARTIGQTRGPLGSSSYPRRLAGGRQGPPHHPSRTGLRRLRLSRRDPSQRHPHLRGRVAVHCLRAGVITDK